VSEMEARLTALMPVRAYHPRLLEEAIGSLHAQTSPRWRLLIVDDGAKPTSIVREALADPRVTLVRNEGRRLAGALNTGMRHAQTDFVASLFADDMWAPEAVRILAEHIEAEPGVDFLHTGRVFIDEDGKRIGARSPTPGAVRPADFASGSPVKHLLCWRRERGLEIGGIDESINSVAPDDWDFPWRMAEHGAVFRAVSEPLYIFRDHRECERLTTHLPRSVHKREMRRIMKRHGVPRSQIERRIAAAERNFLRQCIYRSKFDRWIKTLRGYDARRGWRLDYQRPKA
jgi:glycosyltransferase involved in cell wall biosynthesis